MKILDRALSLVAPHLCVVCGAEGSLLCDWCAPDAFEGLPERCFLCKRLSPDSTTCQKCRRAHPLPRHVWVRTLYDGSAKRLLEGLKFGRQYAAADVIADHLADTLPHIHDDYVVAHIPTATSRIRQRGYDQSELIAKRLSKAIGVRHVRLLTRRGQVRQVGASRAKRLQQLEGMYSVRTRKLTDKKTPILLVDDVSTTGSTLMAVTAQLRKAGYKRVDAAIFAQKE
jgi:ComF family protein